MRGVIPQKRMQQIGSSLPASFDLMKEMPTHWTVAEFPFGTDQETLVALRKVWDAWGLLNETHHALIEAEACKAWHKDLRRPPDESAAAYFCRYYLDDAGLRVYASCEHMLKSISHYKRLHAREHGSGSLLDRVLASLTKREPDSPIAEWLVGLKTNSDWKECVEYRNDWVHNERPNLAGLGPRARTTATRTVFPDGTLCIQGGEEPCKQIKLDDLSGTMRISYVALFQIYRNLIKLMASELNARPDAWIQNSD